MGIQETVLAPMGYSGSGSEATTAAMAAAALAGNNRRGDDGLFGGGILGAMLVASLFGGNRGGLFGGNNGGGADVVAGDVAAKVVELQNTSDLKGEVRAVEAGVRESILEQTIGFGDQFRAIEGKIGSAALDAVKAGFEAKIASLESTNLLSNKIGTVETEIQAVKCHVDAKISASTQAILSQLNADKLDAKNDEIAELRSRNRHMEQTLLFSNQLNSITSQINSLSQKADATNQAINFGTGVIGPQATTSNQVGGK